MKKAILDGLTVAKANEALLHTKQLIENTNRLTESLSLLIKGMSPILTNTEYELLGYYQDIVERNSEMCDLEWLSHPQNVYHIWLQTLKKAEDLKEEADALYKDYENYRNSPVYLSVYNQMFTYLNEHQDDPDLESDETFLALRTQLETVENSAMSILERYQEKASEWGYNVYLAQQYEIRWNNHKEECKKTVYFAYPDFTYYGEWSPVKSWNTITKYEYYIGYPEDDDYPSFPAYFWGITREGRSTRYLDIFTTPSQLFRTYPKSILHLANPSDIPADSWIRPARGPSSTQSIIEEFWDTIDFYETPYDQECIESESIPPTPTARPDLQYAVDITSSMLAYHIEEEDQDGELYGKEYWIIKMEYYDVTPTQNLKDFMPNFDIHDFEDKDYPGKTL